MCLREWIDVGGIMYKLLLVSDKEDVRALYEHFNEWETLGFEKPTVAVSAQDGIDHLNQERYDAVSSLLSLAEGKRFFAYLSQQQGMLGMETARDENRLRREIGSARRALSSRDAQQQAKQLSDYMRVLQWEFFRDLLQGVDYDRERIDERVRMLKMQRVDPNRPVATASFRMPQGDYFLSEVWHYGRERLENALKNIFESEDEDMAYVLLVINPHHMRLIGVPMRDMTGEEVYARMAAHLAACSEILSEYFELTIDVKRIVRYDNLYALGEENAVRVAH